MTDCWEDKGVKRVNTIIEMETATTQKQFEHLHKMIDAKHASANKVYVDSTALKNILYDHSQFCGITDDFSNQLIVKHGTMIASQEAQYCYEKYRDLTGFKPKEEENGDTEEAITETIQEEDTDQSRDLSSDNC